MTQSSRQANGGVRIDSHPGKSFNYRNNNNSFIGLKASGFPLLHIFISTCDKSISVALHKCRPIII